ncbi:hypothetical protein [Spirosoma pollinicola]|uniref:DUF600 domain-containing protein n=1 Tax=Spirosoma pollinicola TaxID=2057025 RepID=A0A2K8Z0A9_9BACT|nr:hypothetical protein [Spirosoma pollinicola]AUD03326.1 hypothetical protein CWM47_16685 [Spirosoma pollinicola]
MKTETIFDLLTTAVNEVITEPWTIAELNIRYLASTNDAECDGTYLDASGDVQVLSTEFPDEVIDVLPELFTNRASEGNPPANSIQMTVSAQGRFAVDYEWDQEIQDEDDHFTKGGTVKDWLQIRKDKYGYSPEVD